MKVTILTTLLLLIPALVYAIDIPKECHVEDRSPGFCSWRCIETLARYHKIERLYGLVEERASKKEVELLGIKYPSNSGIAFVIRAHLKKLDINYDDQKAGNFTTGILKQWADKYGCIVSMKENPSDKIGHALIMSRFGKDDVDLYDSFGDKHTISRAKFEDKWTGRVFVILPDGVRLF